MNSRGVLRTALTLPLSVTLPLCFALPLCTLHFVPCSSAVFLYTMLVHGPTHTLSGSMAMRLQRYTSEHMAPRCPQSFALDCSRAGQRGGPQPLTPMPCLRCHTLGCLSVFLVSPRCFVVAAVLFSVHLESVCRFSAGTCRAGYAVEKPHLCCENTLGSLFQGVLPQQRTSTMQTMSLISRRCLHCVPHHSLTCYSSWSGEEELPSHEGSHTRTAAAMRNSEAWCPEAAFARCQPHRRLSQRARWH